MMIPRNIITETQTGLEVKDNGVPDKSTTIQIAQNKNCDESNPNEKRNQHIEPSNNNLGGQSQPNGGQSSNKTISRQRIGKRMMRSRFTLIAMIGVTFIVFNVVPNIMRNVDRARYFNSYQIMWDLGYASDALLYFLLERNIRRYTWGKMRDWLTKLTAACLG